jgi:hypothetical protein
MEQHHVLDPDPKTWSNGQSEALSMEMLRQATNGNPSGCDCWSSGRRRLLAWRSTQNRGRQIAEEADARKQSKNPEELSSKC